MKCRTPAFTLIELLVVLGIIALIAALLFPVFARAREKARQATCTSNLRQLGLGIFEYMHDYDNTLFPFDSGIPLPPSQEYTTWYFHTTPSGSSDFSRSYVGPYVGSHSLLDCPSMPPNSNGDKIMPAYGINVWGLWHPARPYAGWGAEDRPITLGDVEMPTETLLLGDSACCQAGRVDRYPDINPDGNTCAVAHGRHDGFANVLWLDGHVHALHPVQIGPSIGAEEAHVGRLLKYPYSGQENRDAYFFEMRKPQ